MDKKEIRIIRIYVLPRVDCPTCKGSGMVSAGSAPVPFGSGSCSLLDDFCECVTEQLPDDENEYEITLWLPAERDNTEQWEVAIGGNFLQVWEAGRYANKTYLSFDDGKVAEIALPSVYMHNIHYDQAIAQMMPRAFKIAAAPEMFRVLEKALPIITAEALERDSAHDDPRIVADDVYYTEMRELANAITDVLHYARFGVMPEPPAADYPETEEDCPENVCPHGVLVTRCSECVHAMADPRDRPSAETCAHGYGFVEYCSDCKDLAFNNLISAAESAAEMWDSNSASVDPEEVNAMLVDAVTAAKKFRGEK